MLGLVARLLSSSRARLGDRTILTLIIFLGILMSVYTGLSEVVKGLEDETTWLWFYSLVGLSLGWWLGKTKPGFFMGLWSAILVGFVLAVLHYGNLLPEIWALIRGVVHLLSTILFNKLNVDSAVASLDFAWSEFSGSVNTTLIPFVDWSNALFHGKYVYRRIASLFFWSLVVWGLAYWSGFVYRRIENPIIAVLPSGVILGSSLAYVRGSWLLLVPMAGLTLLLMTLSAHSLRETQWLELPLPFSEELRLDIGLWAGSIIVGLMILIIFLPTFSLRQIASFFHSTADKISQDENVPETISFGDSLGLKPQATPIPPSIFDVVQSPGLPRDHLLGSGPELGEKLVMVVNIDDPLPEKPARYYWKSLTYDKYNGRGWETSETRTISYLQGENDLDVENPNGRMIRQAIRTANRSGGLVHVAGDLVTVDQRFSVAWRVSPEDEFVDLFGSIVENNRYRAASFLPRYSKVQLRSLSGEIPDWVKARYLLLPETVPDRVIELAHSLTASATNPYDKAQFIEDYLRTYPYNLNISAPPPDRDVADYFLFDLQQGYCDYYATAMVVLSRAIGLPSRLAIGYASGLYDEANNRYIVSEADAHSWVEIFFQGFGWIPFEPTSGQPALMRDETVQEFDPYIRDSLAQFPSRWERYQKYGVLYFLGVMLLIILGFTSWAVLDTWRLNRLSTRASICEIYQRIYRYGHKLGYSPNVGFTPYEFASSLSRRMVNLTKQYRWIGGLRSFSSELTILTDIYVKTIYGPDFPDDEIRNVAILKWRRLRVWFWLSQMAVFWNNKIGSGD